MSKILLGAIAMTALCAGQLCAETRYTPAADVSVMGGQYFFDSAPASLRMKADAFFSPALMFENGSQLVPVYTGYYSGMQDVREIAGGSVLTRERMGQTFAAKYIIPHNEFDKYKLRASYGWDFVKETNNESWGNGLFNYKTFSAGVESAYEKYWGSFFVAYDYADVNYPNYTSLLSQSDVILDTTTFSELSQNAGSKVLNNRTHRLEVGATILEEKYTVETVYSVGYMKYPYQAVVNSMGGFDTEKRHDWLQNASVRGNFDLKPLLLSFTVHGAANSSNQNSYDASRTQYISDFYSYNEIGAGPLLSIELPSRFTFYLSTDWTRRFYTGRLTQDVNGNYGDSKINQTTWLSALTVRYPVSEHFFAKASFSYLTASSNMNYEAYYRYNYSANTYAFGMEWRL